MIDKIEVTRFTDGRIFFKNKETQQEVMLDRQVSYFFEQARATDIEKLLSTAFSVIQSVEKEQAEEVEKTQVEESKIEKKTKTLKPAEN